MVPKHGILLLTGIALVMLLVAPAGGQSYEARMEVVPGEGVDVVQDNASLIQTVRICRDCVLRVNVFFTTTDPNLDGKTLTPIPVNYDPTIISVDTSPDPTAVWNGDDANWDVTGIKRGTTTLQAQDPGTGAITDVLTVVVVEVKKAIGRYKLALPKDTGISDTADDEVRSFWVVRSGRYRNEVMLEARFNPAGDEPGCFWWSWSGPAGGARIVKPTKRFTKMLLFKPGTYIVRANCPTHFKEITVHAVAVTNVEWKQHKNPISNNPGTGLAADPGKGKRVFAGRLKHTDSAADARKVKVEATIFPVLAGVDLHFRNFDVDDPSWNAGAVDGDTTGNDNRGSPAKGDPEKKIAATNGSGTATITVRLPRQPGDNLVCGVATTAESQTGLDLDTSIFIKDGKPKRILPAAPTLVAGASPMLTIWRKAHFETDTMTNVANNFRRRKVSSITTLSSTRTQVGFGSSIADKRGQVARFENGEMTELGAGGRTFAIRTNTANTVTVIHAAGASNRPKVGVRVDLIDDDVQKTTVGSPQTDSISALFRHCFIVPRYDQGKGTAPFIANYDAPSDSAAEITKYYKFDTKARNSDSFWVVYLLGAYQYDFDEDNDPGPESATLGIVDDLRGLGANVFTEAEWDLEGTAANYNKHVKYTTAHETFHLWNARHSDGGYEQDYGQVASNLSDKSVNRIRNTTKP